MYALRLHCLRHDHDIAGRLAAQTGDKEIISEATLFRLR